MDLADALGRSGDVEIAQRHGPKAIRGSVRGHCRLECSFRLTVGVDRAKRGVLVDRRCVVNAVDRRRGAEDDATDTGPAGGFEKGDPTGDVRSVVERWLAD